MKLSLIRKQTQTDAELFRMYRSTGQLEYFGELYNRYIPLIYGLCLKYLRDKVRAEDAVMQIFEDLVPKVKKVQVEEFRTWIYTVARNHCLQILRKKDREMLTDFPSEFMESVDIVHLLSKQDDEERLLALEKCMEQLPDPQRDSIRLFFMEEKSYADIAVITKCQVKSVKSYIQNGKRNLKICIESNQTDDGLIKVHKKQQEG